jgi:CheY-like chemotaxis protein
MKRPSPQVLFADDDPDDRDFFCAGMQRLYPQIEVVTFKDGAQLFDSLSGRTTAELPDCLFFDYKMPGVSGPELLQTTGPGTRYHSIPKIVLSTTQRRKDINECLSLGATRFATKPSTDAELDLLLKSLEVLFLRPPFIE